MSLVAEEDQHVLEECLHVAERRNSSHRTTIEATVGIGAVGLVLAAGIFLVGATGGAALPVVLSTLGPYAVSTGVGAGVTSFVSAAGMKVAKKYKDKKLFKKIKNVMKQQLIQQIEQLGPEATKLFNSAEPTNINPDQEISKAVSDVLKNVGIDIDAASKNLSLNEFLIKAKMETKIKYLANKSEFEAKKLKAVMIYVSYSHASHMAKNAKKFHVAKEIDQIIQDLAPTQQRRLSEPGVASRPLVPPNGLKRSDSA